MLKLRHLTSVFAILLAVIGDSWGQSQRNPQPETEPSALSTQQSPARPTPTIQGLSPEQITKGITDGINAAAKEYETRHPAAPSDNSGRWFNFWLVTFTGGLVVVGAGQAFLIFWTLKATETAADAALRQVKVMAAVEGQGNRI
jgi:hypothetical protein